MSPTRIWRAICSLTLLASLLLGAVSTTAANPLPGKPIPGQKHITVVNALKTDRSPELRSIPGSKRAQKIDQPTTIPLGQLKKPGSTAAAFIPDSALQNAPVPVQMPSPSLNFNGLQNTYGVAPPDTNGDIGLKHYVQWVNLGFQVWQIDRGKGQATSVLGPINGNALWSGFGGPCETTNNGDPIVLYDSLADRWFMSQFAITGVNYQCIAVSVSGDPTGAWFRYAYDWGEKMNDYPKFGIWPDGYYMTVNQFTVPDFGWAGAGVAVFEREKMLKGFPARMLKIDLLAVNQNFGGMLPADLDGAPPPQGTPAYFLEVDDSSSSLGVTDELRIWEYKVDWQEPANSTFGQSADPGQPNAVMTVTNFNPLCWGDSYCIPQKGTQRKLDALSDRLMYRLAYRYFPGSQPYESMVANHTVNVGTQGNPRAGVRWYELRRSNGQYSIYQQGTFAGADPSTDTIQRWMGSIAMDWQGNMALGYSMSNSNMYPSIGYTGRLAQDPLNTLPQGEITLFSGPASQDLVSRWGDYSSMSVDPRDECTFWYTQEYSTGGWNWATRVGAFKMPSCTAQPRGEITGKVVDEANNPIAGALLTSGAYMATTGPDGVYTFPALLPGVYDLNAAAAGFSTGTASGLTVQAGAAVTQNFVLARLKKAQVSISITDGYGHPGMPLYASIRVTTPNLLDAVYFTDPLTGKASFELYQNQDYILIASAAQYQSAERLVHYTAATASETFGLLPELNQGCAPGYKETLISAEGFENGGELPPGWSLFQTGEMGNGFKISALNKFEGDYSVLRAYEAVEAEDWLVIPALTVPENALISFREYGRYTLDYEFHAIKLTTGSSQDPAVSTYQLLTQLSPPTEGTWQRTYVDLSAYAGQTVYLAFLYSGFWADDWHLDDFRLLTCQPIAGGRVFGLVSDRFTTLPLNGAAVTGAGGAFASQATPDDPNLPDGFYSGFSPAGGAALQASLRRYAPRQVTVTVAANSVARQDFALMAGQLVSTPTAISISLDRSDKPAAKTVRLSNTGGNGLTFAIGEFNSSTPPVWSHTRSAIAPAHRHVGPKKLNARGLDGIVSYQAPSPGPLSPEKTATSWNSGLTFLWGLGYNTDTGDLWLGETEGVNAGINFRYTRTGVQTSDLVDITNQVNVFAADMAYNPLTGKFWQVNVGGKNCIFEFDLQRKSTTGKVICPEFGSPQRGLAYDSLTDTFYSGSWNDGIINHFDSTGLILDSFDVGLNIAGLAYNPATGHLFVSDNDAEFTDIYMLDVNNQYRLLDSFNIAGLNGYKQSLDIDCLGQLWVASSPSVFKTEPVEMGVCIWKDIPWLTVSPQTGPIPVQKTQDLTLNFNPQGMAAGSYTGYVALFNDTPYLPKLVQLTLTVTDNHRVYYLPTLSR